MRLVLQPQWLAKPVETPPATFPEFFGPKTAFRAVRVRFQELPFSYLACPAHLLFNFSTIMVCAVPTTGRSSGLRPHRGAWGGTAWPPGLERAYDKPLFVRVHEKWVWSGPE